MEWVSGLVKDVRRIDEFLSKYKGGINEEENNDFYGSAGCDAVFCDESQRRHHDAKHEHKPENCAHAVRFTE
jgi:hypothetical protein